ncbi:hypothetical protein GC176_00170 [bacterium]|nr:hypothetical protein [bacterium]
MATLRKKPAKPYKDFPLFPHACGQWAKKINGRMRYFGVWADPEAALKEYLRERDFLQAGLEPPPADGDVVLLKDLCNAFLTSKKQRLDSGELGRGTFTDYKRSCQLALDTFGRLRRAESISPADFVRLRGVITDKYGPVRTGKEITQIRMLFRWGEQQELIGRPRFGGEFVKPSKDVMRRHRQSSLARMFEADEIRAMLDDASCQLKAWLLLGINCAFIQKDLADLPRSAVSLETGFVDFPRQKIAVERRIPLWPESIAALQDSIAARREPANETDADAFFLTAQGHRVLSMRENGNRTDAVHAAMDLLQQRLGIKQARRSYGALRHTFRTIADETCDFPAILRIMGYSDNTISNTYRERISDDRLRTVTDHVRNWLYRDRTS